MANIGFKKAIFTIGEEEFIVDKTQGGTIDAKISGIANEATTVDASDIPFFVYQKGVGNISVDLTVFDLQSVQGLYATLFGVQAEDGISIVGADTAPAYTSLVLVSENANGKDLYFGLTKGKFAHPDIELATKAEGKADPKTVATTGTFIADARGYAYMTAVQSETVTEDLFIKKVNNVKP
ncbi:phage tail protein [Enterococcus casseliflavus]|uniref:major tail protein n=1 Tax=Enterococcus TaxID=1350 RepID=UPI001CBE24C2|nr:MULTISPECIES: major tail protein [Enterococcus]MBZ3642442.1 phage tail protein [Enterococcus casseliflavus]MCD5185874.1 phage tail protein [Enterococcus gallinarum]